ncbi:MAG: HAMP domain-containing histidine kinase [Betaproteobacteria bacterium]|nr:HAMP domain-containing histidine kinase [Betaproteobacteria bacterium]
MNVEATAHTPLQRAIAAIRQQHWLSLTLLALHCALTLELSDPLARALLLSHFGFFLLWQPLWRGGQKLFPGQMGLIIAAAVLLIAAGSWWLMALWISVLFSLIGGNVPGIKNFGQRVVSLLAAVYLLSVLLTWVVPHLFPDQVFSDIFQALVRYGLVIPAVAIFFVRTEKSQTASAYSVDLFYSLLLFLLVVVLVLGAFVIKQVSHGNYVIALAQALIVAAGLLVALSLLWDPRAGFAGIGQLVTRYFLSIGVPFERWMHSLAGLADRERDPDKFVIVAAHEMAGLPWLSGISWQSRTSKGNAGEITKYPTAFTFGGLILTLYTRWSPSPALVLHIRLLARLLGDYYEAKMREQEQRRNAYVQAIYETGSRLTHDVKNLLQTLRSLCAAAETSDESDSEALRLLMQRQLPQITQRLQITLDKLNTKPQIGQDKAPGKDWWQDLRQRFAHERIEFEGGLLPEESTLPADLFASVAENFLQNALEKRKLENNLRILVRLQWSDGFALSVCDDGLPVPDSLATRLFNSPVQSSSGFGIGMYQVARFAREQGYEVALSSNQQGRVCFTLSQSA